LEETHRFDGDYELEKIYEELPIVRREDVFAHYTDTVGADQYEPIGWRDALVTDDDRVAGDVSASEGFYNVIQYGDILEAVHRQVKEHRVEPYGRVSLSGPAHKMSAPIYLEGEEARVEPVPEDPINMGVKVAAGHSGYMGVHYDVGAERQVCSNGMTRFVSDLHFDQDHGSPFQPGLAYQAVDGVLQSTDRVEERLEKAQDRTLSGLDEARLILHDIGVDQVAENPEGDVMNALFEEVGDRDEPSLYEVYQAGTRVVDHYQNSDVPDHYRDTVRDNVARLLDVEGVLPESGELASSVIEDRLNHFVESEDPEPYFTDEQETLRDLAEVHGLA